MDECGGIHRSYRFGVRNTEDEPVLEMGNALDIVVSIHGLRKETVDLSLTVLLLVILKLTIYFQEQGQESSKRGESYTQ